LLLLAFGAALGAQQTAQPADATQNQAVVFRSTASVVALNVTVTDGKHFVGGLRGEDFSVYEDNVPQTVQFFETKVVPLDLILLLDTSASMNDKMDVVHEAALGFLRTLRRGDRACVVGFSDTVDMLQPLTADAAALEAAIKRTQPRGGTALNTALYVALKQFGRRSREGGDVRRQAIAVLTDGVDTSSPISFDDVLAVARKSDVNFYTIALQSKYIEALHGNEGVKRFLSPADFSMKTLALETGAQAFFPEFLQDLKGAYAAIAEELANQYSIGYTPTDARNDGRFRRITVAVTNRPELRLRSRAGYIADTARSAVSALIRYR
jgi:Ca-activated chloride channel family protein